MTLTTITSLGQHGEGVVELDGKRAYVPFTLPGEEVEIAIEGERGTLYEVLAPSPQRVEPFCPYFTQCGGCSLQHLARPYYDGFKRGLVELALSHAEIEVPLAGIADAHGNGRRRATLHARGKSVGYMRARSHDVLDVAACPILVPALRTAAPAIARDIAATIGDCDVSFTTTLTGLDVAIKSERQVRPERLTLLTQRLNLARLAVNGQVVLTARAPALRMGKAVVELPISGFLQATEAAEAALAALVQDGLAGAKSVVDLFCGVGPFALRLAETARVHAVDSDKPSIAALLHAMRHTQGLKPVTAAARDLFRDPLAPAELAGFEAVVFDPPRAGAEAQVRELVRTKLKTIVAVSCEPKTFARDAALLIAGGFRLEQVTPVDQFAWSTHVETVGVFRR